jgi:hypothetical protein
MPSVTAGDQSLQAQVVPRLEELRRQLRIGWTEMATKERELTELKETVLPDYRGDPSP